MRPNLAITTTAAALLLAGCAQPTLTEKARNQTAAYVERFNADKTPVSTVKESDQPYVKAVAVEYRPASRGGVSLKLSATPLQMAISTALDRTGYDISYVGKAEPNRTVTLAITNMEFEKAVKEIAYAAGYVAVVDHKARRVMIAEEATYTYRIDPHSIEERNDEYSTTSTPGSGGSGSSSGSTGSGNSSGGGSSSGAATSTNLKLGSSKSGPGPEDLINAIRSLVGATEKSSTVQYVQRTGMLIVRGNAAELKRVTDLVDLHQRDARTEVELEAAIVEVSLGDDFQYGIDWSRIVPLSGALSGQAAITVSDRGLVSNPSFKANVTTNSVKAVIQALRERTNVNVVAEPRVSALNHRDGYFVRAMQRPYLPEITQSTVQNAGTTQSGKLAYVPDGISFAFKPAVMGPNMVRARILPVITSVGNKVSFDLGQAQLTGYDVVVSQSHLEVELEAGKTSIVGGLSLDRNNNTDSGVPLVSDVPLIGNLLTSKIRNGQKTQTVMLLRANIVPPRNWQSSLIGESL